MTLLRKFVAHLFPPSRRPVTWKAAWPLVVFLLLFGGIVGGLYVNNQIDFVYPWAFLFLLVTPWVWWMQAAGHSGLATNRGNVAVLFRLFIVGLLVAVIAWPRAVRTSNVVSVVYAMDVSDSVNEARNLAMQVISSSAAEKPRTDEAGLVVFGGNAAVEYPPRVSFPTETYVNSLVSKDSTNLQQSLSLSAAMLPEENTGRIVLISDGTETRGELKRAITELQGRGVEVDVLPIDYAYENEVLLERLDLPRLVRLDTPFEATTVLTSLKPGKGKLKLLQNGEEIYAEDVEFQAGKSRFAIPLQVNAPGYYEYKARIEVPSTADSRVENNTVENYLYIDGANKILIVTDPAGDPREWQYLEKALQGGSRKVDTKTAFELPHAPLALMPYDVIIFANVPADTLAATQQQAVHDAVRNLGIGFVMLGGPNSFGPGGYQNSPIEDCLPVSMEISKKKILPKGALVIILHTCEFPQGNTWAKRITKEAIKVLSAEDEVGAIGYGMNGDEWIFELTPASEYSELVKKVNGAQIGDMPEFTSTMEMGLKGLLKSDAASRHMIIISDGDPPLPPPQTLKKFKDAQATVSTVAVFPHDPRDSFVLKSIAGQTGGRFYFPSDPRELPSIFIKEAKTLRRNQVQTRTFIPQLENDHPMVRGMGQPPKLHGYVLASMKEDPRATVVLSAPPAKEDMVTDDSDVDPLLAHWRYGLGASVAYTSDFTNDWGRDWVKWDQFKQIVTQMTSSVARVKKDQYLRVYTYVNGNEGVVVVEDFHPEETMLDMQMQVTSSDDPNAAPTRRPLRQIAPRRYQASVPLQGQGRYQVQVSATAGDRNETAYGGFIVSYSPEYLRFQANPIVLREIAEQTGGVELDLDADQLATQLEAGEKGVGKDLADQIYNRREPKRSTRSVFDTFLIVLACMIPLDVAVRRVQFDFTWLKRMFSGQKRQSTETMGTLLARKQQTQVDLQKQAAKPPATSSPPTVKTTQSLPTRPLPPRKSSASATASSKAEADKPVSAPEPSPTDGTTSRLLAMKRKREQERDDERS